MAFPTGWAKQQPIVIDNTKVIGAAVLTNYPFLVTLDHLNLEIVDAGANAALNGGGDIRFSSDSAGTIQLPCEIVSFVTSVTPTSRACEIWVKVPSVSYTVNTTIYIWYKKAAEVQPVITDPYGRNAVWAGYSAVYHLGSLVDATGNGFDLTLSGTPSLSTDSPIAGGSSYAFPGGGSNWLQNIAWSKIPHPYTLSAWHKASNAGSTAIWSQGDLITNFPDSILWISTAVQQRGNATFNASATLTTGAWYKTDAVYAANDTELYINGASVATHTPAGQTAGAWSTMYIGAFARGSSKIPFFGFISEVRIRPLRQTTGWTTTEYNNQFSPSTFAAAGIPVAVGGGSTLIIDSAGHGVTSNSVSSTQIHSLTIAKTLHNLTNDNVTFSLRQSLTVFNCVHLENTDNATLYGPTNFTPHPDRIQQPKKSGRALSPTVAGRTTIPTNNRITRI